jgi:hypothetical protein
MTALISSPLLLASGDQRFTNAVSTPMKICGSGASNVVLQSPWGLHHGS